MYEGDLASRSGTPIVSGSEKGIEGVRINRSIEWLDAPAEIDSNVAEMGIRPEDLVIEYNTAKNQTSAKIDVFEQVGSSNIEYLQVDSQDEEIVAEVNASKQFEPRDTVGVSVNTERIHLFDEDGESLHSPPLYQHTQDPRARARNQE